MNKLIIVCGLPASGKTVLAKELSKKLGIVCFHKDSFKEGLYDIMKLSTMEDSVRVGAMTIQLMYKVIDEQLANGQSIIMEAPFNYDKDYSLFREWRESYGTNIYTVICSIDHNERKKRFTSRERHQSHREIDRTVIKNFVSDETVYKKISGKKIFITTNKPVNKLVKEIITKIK